jgi:lysophospholipase L1-like esterase
MRRLALLILLASLWVAAPARASTLPVRVLQQGQSAWFYANMPEIDATFAGNGSTLTVFINNKAAGYRVTLGTSGDQTVRLAWNLAPGPQRFSMIATSGEVDILAWSYPLGGARMQAGGMPKMVVYGDSIAAGRFTGGGDNQTGGWADQLPSLLGTRVANVGAPGMSAACWGASHLGRVRGQSPSGPIIVAFGTNDMVPGKDAGGCNPTKSQFRAGIDTILTGLSDLGQPVYVSAILPVKNASESNRADWNDILQDEAAAHDDPYVDPSPVLDPSTDYANALHPNQQGHDKLAQFWTGVLGGSQT